MTDGFGLEPVEGPAVRPLQATAAALVFAATALAALPAGPAGAAPRTAVPASVLVVADVGETAQRTMPAVLWRKLVTEYVGAHPVTAEDGTALPDDAHCRSAHALYAVFATFDRATRLPGLAQDTDRAYGIARFTVRNCLTGIVAPTKTLRVESDPLSEADRAGDESRAERTWEHAVRRTLAREPLVLTAVARIVRIENGVVLLESGGAFSVNQLLRDIADPNAKPHTPIELVVYEARGRYIAAAVVGKGTPQVGDYVEAAPGSAK
ncbi:MAG: hypothetical protein JWM87_1862 [Candidatus Eremiobacteraeota bacterium]|nr:hypothetical protein [Candidatus Eremiobacteraeota bacterium]